MYSRTRESAFVRARAQVCVCVCTRVLFALSYIVCVRMLMCSGVNLAKIIVCMGLFCVRVFALLSVSVFDSLFECVHR